MSERERLKRVVQTIADAGGSDGATAAGVDLSSEVCSRTSFRRREHRERERERERLFCVSWLLTAAVCLHVCVFPEIPLCVLRVPV